MMHMNNRPMYRSPWNMPSQPQYKRPSKVVNIPVHFVGSERSRNDSAIKIQKVVRGFLVRSTMKKIDALRVEVEKIEQKVSDPQMVEIMRRDNKERLRVSETIMNLLLRLDSVRVLHYSGVRDCRKSVIKRAIVLQEMVDQMEGINDHDQPPQTTQAEDADAESGSVGVDSQGEKMEAEEKEKEEEGGEVEGVGEKIVGTGLVEEVEENCLVKEEEEGCKGASELFVADSQGEKMDGLGNEEEKMEVEENEEGDDVGEESVGTSLIEEVEENCLVKEEDGQVGWKEEEEEGGRGRKERDWNNRELLERMIEDNERMMGMMAQLFDKNERQTRLLSSLSQRVEQLERAFACEKLRRKKRRNVDAKHKEPEPKNGCI